MHTRQGGFSLVELVLATAVTGLVIGLLGTAIYQMLTVSAYGNDRLTALHELQNAAHWFSLDGQKAVSAGTGGGLLLTISDNTSVSYTLTGTELRRSAGGHEITLARNITSLDFTVAGRLVTMSLTAAPVGRDNVSENGSYRVYLRPSGGN